MGLWRWYRTRMGMEWINEGFRTATRHLNGNTTEMLHNLYQGEIARLIDCDPIFVSREMCEVVGAAYPDFEPEPLIDTDLVTPRGFLFYEDHFDVPDRFDEPTTIKAVSWNRMFAHDDPEVVPKLRKTLSQAAGPIEAARAEAEMISMGARPSGIAVTIYQLPGESPVSVPPAIPMHVTPWYFNMTYDGNEVDENDAPTGAAWWWRIIQTTFRLMQQKIAVRHQARPDRSARREAKSLRFPNEQTVVVVRLRREDSEPHDLPTQSANYSHRFIVNGHWRNQWYPSISDHRQIWISPFVKGDPGLPLIVKPRRVFQWER